MSRMTDRGYSALPYSLFFFCFLLLGSFMVEAAETALYPAENPSPNGVYIRCGSSSQGKCYDLRDTFRTTNTQLEHVADRMLLRTGGTGFVQKEDEIMPLRWETPSGDTVLIRFADHPEKNWSFIPDGPFLINPEKGMFIFVSMEREYEASEGGIITVP